ncbi:hypothetical protein [Flavobacterium aurantiibacter]|uniref:Uncharacterized protein n=1 Tax=Flavobacterium aurantiibacter TaxID=2023067 RepID=A0A255ZX23_9FLAO|nr:hypothetical protein [Flavobacterium aurantiibacter]OYQ46043.1 hypothetical protein CHX27_05090 [Flavobacterium aurantiibacter]
MSKYAHIQNIADLDQQIYQVASSREQQKLVLVQQSRTLQRSLTDEDFAITQLDRFVRSRFFKVSISRLAVSFFSGVVAKRLIFGKSTGVVGGLLGTILQALVTRKVMEKTDNLAPSMQQRVADLLRKLKINT